MLCELIFVSAIPLAELPKHYTGNKVQMNLECYSIKGGGVLRIKKRTKSGRTLTINIAPHQWEQFKCEDSQKN